MNPNDLDLRLLRSFLAVAQCGKISTAAKQLHLSQPAVTAHLRRLEEIVGKPLISRSTRGVRLTTQGHTLQTLATEIQNTLSRIEASFHREPKLGGDLRFGASLTIASQVIPGFLAEFCRIYPDVVVELRVDNTEVVLESVREGSYPFGLVEGNSRAAGLRLEQFVEDEINLGCRYQSVVPRASAPGCVGEFGPRLVPSSIDLARIRVRDESGGRKSPAQLS